MKRRALTLLAVAIVACSNDTTTAPTVEALAGTWSLRTVDGASLPIVLPAIGTGVRTLRSDVLTLGATGTLRRETTTRDSSAVGASTIVSVETGTYAVTNNRIVLPFGTAPASLSQITLTISGQQHIYRRP
jgi:hypothetical protein